MADNLPRARVCDAAPIWNSRTRASKASTKWASRSVVECPDCDIEYFAFVQPRTSQHGARVMAARKPATRARRPCSAICSSRVLEPQRRRPTYGAATASMRWTASASPRARRRERVRNGREHPQEHAGMSFNYRATPAQRQYALGLMHKLELDQRFVTLATLRYFKLAQLPPPLGRHAARRGPAGAFAAADFRADRRAEEGRRGMNTHLAERIVALLLVHTALMASEIAQRAQRR
jgi:hypothetical protein